MFIKKSDSFYKNIQKSRKTNFRLLLFRSYFLSYFLTSFRSWRNLFSVISSVGRVFAKLLHEERKLSTSCADSLPSAQSIRAFLGSISGNKNPWIGGLVFLFFILFVFFILLQYCDNNIIIIIQKVKTTLKMWI